MASGPGTELCTAAIPSADETQYDGELMQSNCESGAEQEYDRELTYNEIMKNEEIKALKEQVHDLQDQVVVERQQKFALQEVLEEERSFSEAKKVKTGDDMPGALSKDEDDQQEEKLPRKVCVLLSSNDVELCFYMDQIRKQLSPKLGKLLDFHVKNKAYHKVIVPIGGKHYRSDLSRTLKVLKDHEVKLLVIWFADPALKYNNPKQHLKGQGVITDERNISVIQMLTRTDDLDFTVSNSMDFLQGWIEK